MTFVEQPASNHNNAGYAWLACQQRLLPRAYVFAVKSSVHDKHGHIFCVIGIAHQPIFA